MRLARLRQARERALLTQEQLAQRAGVAKSTVNRIEQGLQEARISTVRRLAEALGVTAAELTADERPAPKEPSGRKRRGTRSS